MGPIHVLNRLRQLAFRAADEGQGVLTLTLTVTLTLTLTLALILTLTVTLTLSRSTRRCARSSSGASASRSTRSPVRVAAAKKCVLVRRYFVAVLWQVRGAPWSESMLPRCPSPTSCTFAPSWCSPPLTLQPLVVGLQPFVSRPQPLCYLVVAVAALSNCHQLTTRCSTYSHGTWRPSQSTAGGPSPPWSW